MYIYIYMYMHAFVVVHIGNIGVCALHLYVCVYVCMRACMTVHMSNIGEYAYLCISGRILKYMSVTEHYRCVYIYISLTC